MRDDLFRGESVTAALRAARFILAQTAPVVLRCCASVLVGFVLWWSRKSDFDSI